MTLRVIIFLLFINSYLFSQNDNIFLKIEKNHQGIQTFIAEAQITVEMERLRIPRKKLTLFYKHPDKFKIESDGFAMIPRIGLLIFPNQLNSEKYELEFVLEDTISGSQTYKYLMKIKNAKNTLPSEQKFFIWLDKSQFLIRQVELINFRGRTNRVNIFYGKLKEGYHMPSRVEVKFENLTNENTELPEFSMKERTSSRIPRSGSVTIVFTNYLINQSLEDNIFEKQQ